MVLFLLRADDAMKVESPTSICGVGTTQYWWRDPAGRRFLVSSKEKDFVFRVGSAEVIPLRPSLRNDEKIAFNFLLGTNSKNRLYNVWAVKPPLRTRLTLQI